MNYLHLPDACARCVYSVLAMRLEVVPATVTNGERYLSCTVHSSHL